MTTNHTLQGVAYAIHPRGVVCHANIIHLVKPNQNVFVIRPPRLRTAPQQRGGYDDYCAIAHSNINGTLAAWFRVTHSRLRNDEHPIVLGTSSKFPSVPLEFGVSAASRGRVACDGVGPCRTLTDPNGPRKVAVAQKTVMAVAVIRPDTPSILSHRIKLRHERCDVSDILYPGDKGALAAWHPREGQIYRIKKSHDTLCGEYPPTRSVQVLAVLVKVIRPGAPESLNSQVAKSGGWRSPFVTICSSQTAPDAEGLLDLRETTCPGFDAPDGGLRGDNEGIRRPEP